MNITVLSVVSRRKAELLLVSLPGLLLALKMEAICFSKMSALLRTTWPYDQKTAHFMATAVKTTTPI
jgi:hypothetical protein